MTSLLLRRRSADGGEDAKCEARNRDVKVKCQRGLLKLNCLKFGCVSGRRGDDAPLSLFPQRVVLEIRLRSDIRDCAARSGWSLYNPTWPPLL